MKIGQLKRSRQGIFSGAGGGSGRAEWTKRDESEQAQRRLQRKDGRALTADLDRIEVAQLANFDRVLDEVAAGDIA